MNWGLWIGLQIARIAALWAWSQATEIRRSMRRVLGTLAIAMLAWLWPVGILIVIAVQIALSFQHIEPIEQRQPK